jgi:hypothetical protein
LAGASLKNAIRGARFCCCRGALCESRCEVVKPDRTKDQ